MIETSGEVKMNRTAFLQTVTEFRDDLLTELSERVQELTQREFIDVQGQADLEKQVEVRREEFNDALARKIDDTDWLATLAAIRTLEPFIGPLL